MKIRVLISGRNYDAAEGIPFELALPEGGALDDALAELSRQLPGDRRLPDNCLVAVSGVHVGTLGRHRPHGLRDGDELLIVAPVAGG